MGSGLQPCGAEHETMQLYRPIAEGWFPGYEGNRKLLLRKGKIAITVSTRKVSKDTSALLGKEVGRWQRGDSREVHEMAICYQHGCLTS